ncbi:DUF488 domain-containing protein [bacterium]|nr:MAG: DUF488 domain-containing protein [bacterium]
MSTILTAGYGNRGFAGFIELLKSHGVTHFVDVRSVPQSSYWEDFRRQNLEHLIPQTGLRYVWMGDTLGGVKDSPILCKDPKAVDLEPLRHTDLMKIGVEKVKQAAAREGWKLCLVCGCLRPENCHRSRLVAPAILEAGLDLRHIDERGELLTQAEVAAQSIDAQGSLF